jgi:LEA14-like dessication related protein
MTGTVSSRLFRSLLVITLALGGCARLNQEVAPVEKPSINLVAMRVLPPDGALQRVELGLRVMNPNGFAIEARGLVVNVGFNDIQVLNGVASSIPILPAYGEVDVPVTVSADLISTMRLIKTLMDYPDDPLTYRLEARLDLKRVLGGRVVILKQGEISARPPPPARAPPGGGS